MKIIILIAVAALFSLNGFAKTAGELKRYEIKSGIIEYKTRTFGKVLFTKIDTRSTKTVAFSNYGAKESQDEISIDNKNKETHTLVVLDNGVTYSVDFKKEQITKTTDAMVMMHMEQNKDMGQTGEEMLIAMGAKKTGTGEVLGYECDIWEVSGGKQWMYKGVVLKIEMVVMGITTLEEATSIKFNVAVAKKYFDLPDFEIIDLTENEMDYSDADDGPSQEEKEKMKNMTYEEFKAMIKRNDPEGYKEMTEEELQSAYKMMKMYGGGK